MASHQYGIPGGPWVVETGVFQAALPGFGYVSETAAVVSVVDNDVETGTATNAFATTVTAEHVAATSTTFSEHIADNIDDGLHDLLLIQNDDVEQGLFDPEAVASAVTTLVVESGTFTVSTLNDTDVVEHGAFTDTNSAIAGGPSVELGTFTETILDSMGELSRGTATNATALTVASVHAEAAGFSESIEDSRTYFVDEAATFSEATVQHSSFTNTVVEHGTATPAFALVTFNNVVESGTATSAQTLRVTSSLVESASASNAVPVISSALTNNVVEGPAAAVDVVLSVLTDTALSSGTAAETVANTFVLGNNVVESGAATNAQALTVVSLLTDAVSASSVVAQTASMTQLVVESGFFSDFTQGAGVYGAWTTHLDTFAMSRYTNTPFRSMAVVDGVPLGATEIGVYRLDADKDAGVNIDASVVHDWTDDVLDRAGEMRSSEYLKHPRFLYLGALTAGSMQCTLGYVGRNGNEAFAKYNILTKNEGAFATGRAILGRGITSRYLQPAFNNVRGAPFTITDATLVVDQTVRRT